MPPSPLFRRSPLRQPTHHRNYEHLTPSQVATWMQYGFVHVPHAFPREAADAATRDVWVRLGYDPHDPRTWKETTHMESVDGRAHRVKEFAPKAWGAICEIIGGAERIEGGEDGCWFDDGFIVNLGNDDGGDHGDGIVEGKNVDGWHVDGDFFVHFLDSREQGLLLLVLWGDVIENAGGTVICCDGIGKVARWLYEHPEGTSDNLVPLSHGKEERWYASEFAEECNEFFELTGEAGDVYILHPFMIHSAQRNMLRIPRFITNPNVMLKEPFNYDRKDLREYSLIELKTLKELGMERLPGWRITGERKGLEQDYWKEHEGVKREQEERMRLAVEMEEERRRLSARPVPPVPPPIPPRNYLPHYAEFYGPR